MTPAPAEKLGTGHGESINSNVRYVNFRREANPFRVMSVRYESRARLIELGVLTTPIDSVPNPFPARYVPDPSPRR